MRRSRRARTATASIGSRSRAELEPPRSPPRPWSAVRCRPLPAQPPAAAELSPDRWRQAPPPPKHEQEQPGPRRARAGAETQPDPEENGEGRGWLGLSGLGLSHLSSSSAPGTAVGSPAWSEQSPPAASSPSRPGPLAPARPLGGVGHGASPWRYPPGSRGCSARGVLTPHSALS